MAFLCFFFTLVYLNVHVHAAFMHGVRLPCYARCAHGVVWVGVGCQRSCACCVMHDLRLACNARPRSFNGGRRSMPRQVLGFAGK